MWCWNESVPYCSFPDHPVPQAATWTSSAQWTGSGRAHRSWFLRQTASAPDSCGGWWPGSQNIHRGTAVPPGLRCHDRYDTWGSLARHWRQKRRKTLWLPLNRCAIDKFASENVIQKCNYVNQHKLQEHNVQIAGSTHNATPTTFFIVFIPFKQFQAGENVQKSYILTLFQNLKLIHASS